MILGDVENRSVSNSETILFFAKRESGLAFSIAN